MCARTYKTLQMLSGILGDTYINPLGVTRTPRTHKVRVVRTSAHTLAQGGATGAKVENGGDVLTSAYTITQCETYLRLSDIVAELERL